MENKKVHADPTKDFFVTMITRDISLQDCIFDLLDNSIDGARRAVQLDPQKKLSDFSAKINISDNGFSITDNCGGISLSDAVNYAFHFGRRPDSPLDVKHGIGLYGIGMKRAIFKMGKKATVESETEKDSFLVDIDVDQWEKKEDWDFELDDKGRSGINGTKVEIVNLYDAIKTVFRLPSFITSLKKMIARDYSFIISEGFEVHVNGALIPSHQYSLKQGEEVAPEIKIYDDDGVSIKIVAGMADELSDDIEEELRPEKSARWGWFVVCNDRVVLAADKSEKTVWGNTGRMWHPQYNGFCGFVFFSSDDPKKLPWTTTKRDIDADDPLYQRTVTAMRDITNKFIEYTNRRKSEVEVAKMAEHKATPINIKEFTAEKLMSFPRAVQAQVPAVEMVTISYKKPKKEVERIKEHIGNWGMSARDVGIATFQYYVSAELGE